VFVNFFNIGTFFVLTMQCNYSDTAFRPMQSIYQFHYLQIFT